MDWGLTALVAALLRTALKITVSAVAVKAKSGHFTVTLWQ